MTVTCWRSLGENVFNSLHKGQPVVVSGRYYMREYTVDEATRTSYELEATAVGHDLTRGVAEFRRVSHAPLIARVNLDDEGIPSDDSDHFLDLDDSQGGVEEEAQLAVAS